MVGLMGAQFSKPLVTNKVTHLICYKFEGEKYELAKKIRKINLVNHRWLEDCLRNWELLPEINYKSGYELEMMEAEAKDSEEEAEDVNLKQSGGKDMNKNPHDLKVVMASAHELPKSAIRVPAVLPNSTMPADPSVANSKDMLPTPVKVSGSSQASRFDKVNISEVHGSHNTGVFIDAQLERTKNSTKVENDLATTSKEAGMPSYSRSKYSSYTRKTPRSMSFAKVSSNVSGFPEANLDRFEVDDVLDNTSGVEPLEARIAPGCLGTPQRGSESCHGAESSSTLLKRE